MRVLIDGYWLEKPRGLGRYVREVLHALAIHGKDLEVVVLVSNRTPPKAFIEPDKLIYLRVWHQPYPVWEQIVLPGIANRIEPDVIHCPYNTAPIFRGKHNYIVTVHDLIFLDHLGRGAYQLIGNLYRRFMVTRLSKKNTTVLTVSNSSARLIKERLGFDAATIYTPTDTGGIRPREEAEPVEPIPVILHVGGTAPHKNTSRVIEAFNSLDIDSILIILGIDAKDPLARRFASPKILFPGWIDDAEVARLYARASLMVFPSLFEGYGLPIIESFMADVPVLTSDRVPMSEIAGDAALLVDPESVSDIAAGMRKLLNNKDIGSFLRNKGRARLNKVNGKTFFDQLVNQYKRAVMGGR